MTTEQRAPEQHFEEQLSGYIDGELTQQERQRVSLHCDQCASCRQKLTELTELRQRMGMTRLSVVGEDQWRETMNDAGNHVLRGLGWILFIAGLLVSGGIGLVAFIGDDSISMSTKLALTAAYGGLAVLFISVLRQRLRERKTDKYKDVEI